MRYFMLEEDKGYINRPRLLNWMKVIEPRNLVNRDYSKIPKRIIFEIESNKNTDFVDIITVPFLLVSKKIYKLLEKFEPNLQFKEVILLDKGYGRVEEYYMPLIQVVDCLTDKTVFNMDNSIINKAFINPLKMKDNCLFAFKEGPKSLYVIRLDVAECILRREAYGFTLKEPEYDIEKDVRV